MIDFPRQYVFTLKLESDPSKSVHIDICYAYDQAAMFQRHHGDDWLLEWGEWLSSELEFEELGYSQVRQLWEMVAATFADIIDLAKKNAAIVASSLYCTAAESSNTTACRN